MLLVKSNPLTKHQICKQTHIEENERKKRKKEINECEAIILNRIKEDTENKIYVLLIRKLFLISTTYKLVK